MNAFAYMFEWFLVLIAIVSVIGIASLAYWAWNSDKTKEDK